MLLPIPLLSLFAAAMPGSAHPTGGSLGFVNERALGTAAQNISIFQNVTRICGTGEPSNELVQAHASFLEQSRNSKNKRQASPPLVVQTYVHFVSTTDQMNYYPPSVRTAMVTNQVSILTTLYRPAGISFRLISTTWTVNDAWATDAASTAMKQALRRGSYSALNIYFQTNLSSPPYTYTAASTLLGYCTLPTNVTYTGPAGALVEYPTVDYAADGCNVLASSMPKAPFPAYGYNLGKTAVHEVGHWFGLLHTFQVCGLLPSFSPHVSNLLPCPPPPSPSSSKYIRPSSPPKTTHPN
ncbi:hypothetical protein BDR22DRAFT_211251 [Usnea florida]